MTTYQSYSMADVATHRTELDCWIVINEHIYDVSAYLADHPGGVEIVSDIAG